MLISKPYQAPGTGEMLMEQISYHIQEINISLSIAVHVGLMVPHPPLPIELTLKETTHGHNWL